jgi:NCS2 family nucleobase:cation symporter-2
VIVAGLFGFLIAPVFASVVRFFPPVVTGCIITIIGISLFPVALRWIRGNPTITTTVNGVKQTVENPNFGSATSLLLAVLTLVVTLAIARFAPGFWSWMAVLLGLMIGTLIATILGLVKWGAVGQGAVVEFPQPFFFGAPQFSLGVIVSLCIVALVIMAETTADLLAVGEIIGTDVDKKRIAAGLRADMGATALAPIFNGFPISAFAQNVGMVALTGIKSRFVVAAGGGILVVLGLLPVLGRVMNAIPQPVLGGAGIVLFGSVAAAGIRTLSRVEFTNSNVLIVAASIGVGVIPITVPEIYNHIPEWLVTIFAVVLNLAFNHFSGTDEPVPAAGH